MANVHTFTPHLPSPGSRWRRWSRKRMLPQAQNPQVGFWAARQLPPWPIIGTGADRQENCGHYKMVPRIPNIQSLTPTSYRDKIPWRLEHRRYRGAAINAGAFSLELSYDTFAQNSKFRRVGGVKYISNAHPTTLPEKNSASYARRPSAFSGSNGPPQAADTRAAGLGLHHIVGFIPLYKDLS